MINRTSLIDSLQRTLSETEVFFRSPASVLGKSYASGKWSMHEILVHLADHESVALDRLRRLCADSGPVLLGYDQDRWCTHLMAGHRSIRSAGALFTAARTSLIDLLQVLPATVDARIAMHQEQGPQRLVDVCATWMHTDHHLGQLRAIAAGTSWPVPEAR